MPSFACEIFIKVKNGLMMNPGVEKRPISLCLAALLCDQLLPIRESFDFTVEWFADFELFASTGERTCVKVQRVL